MIAKDATDYKGFCGYENCLEEPIGVLQMADGEIPVCDEHATSVKRYQCGSCERVFDKPTADNECPYCFSGNWVEGYIDDVQLPESISDDGSIAV